MELKLLIEKGLVWGLLLFPPAVVAWVVVKQFGYALFRSRKSEPTVAETTVAVYPESLPDIEPATMTVRQIKQSNGAEGSVIVRLRASKGLVTGMLIIWAGKNKKAKKRKGSDSFYDLGAIAGTALTEEAVATMMAEAQRKFDELANPRKVVENPAAVEPAVIALPVVDQSAMSASVPAAPSEAQRPETATVVTEDVGSQDPAIRLRKHPAIFRGVVLEAGVMTRAVGGKIIDQYGVKYRTREGVEDAVWGADLKRALDDARAKVGDAIEILKIGRKVVEDGKAPMNLYQVFKLGAASTPSH